MLFNDDLELITYANELCNRLGLDIISTVGVIAFAMELYEHKMLSKKELEGIELTWGNTSAVIKLIKKIGTKEEISKL